MNPREAPSERSLILVLGLIAALGPLTIDMYLPALPSIGAALGADDGAVQLSLAAYFLGLSMGQLVYGPLADRYGRRPPLLVGLALYVVGSLGCAAAPTIEALIACRFVQALGGCAGIVVSRAIVRDLYAREQAARVYSRLMLVMGAAPIVAPLLGGLLSATSGWRSIFMVLAGVGVVTIALTARTIAETLAPRESTPDGAPARVLTSYREVLRDRGFVAFALAGGIAQAGMFAYITGSPYVIIEHFRRGPNFFAWMFGLNALGLIAASQVNGRLLARGFSSERVLGCALVALCIAGAGLLAAALSGAELGWVLAPLFLYVSALGFTFPNAAACAMADQGSRAGSASALLGTLQFVIASICSAAVSRLGGGPVGLALVVATCGAGAAISFVSLRPRGNPAGR
jgi:DHA1 family bicyclomycin/chloramphenicol resistance-like MFS transporter